MRDGGPEMLACPTTLTPAHLLRNHDDERSQGCATNSRDCEELDAALQVVRLPDNLCFHLKLSVNVVKISSRLYGAETKSQKRLPGLAVPVFFDQPSRRLAHGSVLLRVT